MSNLPAMNGPLPYATNPYVKSMCADTLESTQLKAESSAILCSD